MPTAAVPFKNCRLVIFMYTPSILQSINICKSGCAVIAYASFKRLSASAFIRISLETLPVLSNFLATVVKKREIKNML